jgi:hypothetical protein
MAGGWGGRRPGAGAKKGFSPKRKRVQALIDAMLPAAPRQSPEAPLATPEPARRQSPLQFLAGIYNNPNETPERRMEAAAIAAPYLHCKLSALPVTHPSRVDADGIPIIDVSPPDGGSSGGQTIINIVPVEAGHYMDHQKAGDQPASVPSSIDATATPVALDPRRPNNPNPLRVP